MLDSIHECFESPKIDNAPFRLVDRINSIADRAAAETKAGKLRATLETLGPIRKTLSALRRI